MQLTYYASANCFLRRKIEGAAKIAGVPITRQENAEADVSGVVFVRYPALLTPTGMVTGSNAVMRYIGEAFPTTELCGCTLAQRALVGSIVDAITVEVEQQIIACEGGAPKDKAIASIRAAFAAADAALKKQTYIAGQRLSLADLTLAGGVAAAMDKQLFTKGEVSSFPNLARHLNTVAGRCQWGIEIPVTPPACTGDAKKGKEVEKKTEKKAEKKEQEGVAEEKREAPKVKDPIELLPLSDFDMDAWKRMYSNAKDLRGEAMPYFWDKLDKEGYSFWRIHFNRSSDTENTQVYQASNLLGMFLQRIDNYLRKYMFAVCNVMTNKEDPEHPFYDVEGVFMIRGQTMPVKLEEHDQFSSFTWTKLDTEKDKDTIANWFCESDELEGRTIEGCKVYK